MNALAIAAQRELDRRRSHAMATPHEVVIPEDFAEFAEKCCIIRSRSKFVPFKLFPYQVELGKLLRQYRRVEIFKSRQVGVSETVIGATAQDAMLNPGFSSLIFSIGQNESTELAKRIKQMPRAGLVKWKRDNTRELQPEGGGILYFRPSSSAAGRGFPSVTRLVFDEAGFIPNLQELLAAAVPAQEMGGDTTSTVLISTMPEEGMMSYFWQSFLAGQTPSYLQERIDEARNGEQGFLWWEDDNGTCKVLIHRRANPMLDCEEGYLERLMAERGVTRDQAIREYDLGMPRGDGALFEAALVDKAAVGQWAEPVPGHRYLAGIDPNFGGADYFSLTIWDVTLPPYRLVAQYHQNNQRIERSLVESLKLLERYRPVITAIERNSGGQIVLERFTSIAPRLRFEPVTTSRQSKLQNTDRLAIALEQEEIIFPPDWAGVNEMKNFSAIKREATVGHDDMVMSAAVAFAWLHAAHPAPTGLGRCIAY